MTNEIQHLFLSLLAICMTFCEVFAHITSPFFGHLIVELWKFFLYSGFKPFIRHMCYEYFFQPVAWLLIFSNIFCWADVLL